jgi:hypothetical protein
MPVLTCPHCGQQTTVGDQLLGRKVSCPHCRGVFRATPPQPGPTGPAAPADPFDFGGPLDDTGDSRPRRRYRPGGKMPLSTRLAATFAIVTAVVMALPIGGGRRRAGFDVEQVFLSALAGGVAAAVGYGIGYLIEGGRRDDDD